MKVEAMLQSDILVSFFEQNFLTQKTVNKSILFKDIMNEAALYVHKGLLPFLMLVYGVFTTFFLTLVLAVLDFQLTVILFLLVSVVFVITFFSLQSKIKIAAVSREHHTEKKFSILDFLLNNISQVAMTENRSKLLNSFTDAATKNGIALANSLSYSQLPRLVLEILIYLITAVFLLLYMSDVIKNFDVSIIPVYLIGFMKLIPALNLIYQNASVIKFVYPSVEKISTLLSAIDRNKIHASNFSLDGIVKTGNRLVEVEKVSFGYAGKDTLHEGVNFVLEDNHWIFIQGPSGSGKSTFVEIVLGLIPPSSGKVRWINTLKRSEIRYLSQVSSYRTGNLQEYSELFGQRSVYISNNFGSLLDLLELDIKQLRDYMTWSDLELTTLSGGELQRVQLFLALISEPKILILDEATNAIDKELERKILTGIRNTTNIALLHISHGDMVRDIYSKTLMFSANGSVKETVL
jgi:ABC-type multidrug transport system fused ATPase/permease subunit